MGDEAVDNLCGSQSFLYVVVLGTRHFKEISRICCETARSLLQMRYTHKRFGSVEENLPGYLFGPLPSSLCFLSPSLISLFFLSVESCNVQNAVCVCSSKLQSYVSVLSFILPDKQPCPKYLFTKSMSFFLAFIFYQLVFLSVSVCLIFVYEFVALRSNQSFPSQLLE